MTAPFATITDVVAAGVIVERTWSQFHNPQPFPIHARTADFRDFGDRQILAKLGVFSVDRNRR